MAFETTGTMHALFEAQQITERFRKRTFVVELEDGRYPQQVEFQLTGDRCELLDGFKVGDKVRVEFNLRGRKWESKTGDIRYFNSLDVWTLRNVGEAQDAAGGPPAHDDIPPMDDTDIPF